MKKFFDNFETIVEALMIKSRHLMSLMNVSMILVLVILVWHHTKLLFKLLEGEFVGSFTGDDVMIYILILIEGIFMAGLVIVVMKGSYQTYVSKIDFTGDEKQDWIDKLDAGSMKVKLSLALVSISGIHLLNTFLNLGNNSIPLTKITVQIVIHVVFVGSAVMLAYTDKMSKYEKNDTI